jgi:hypothetical protein
MKIVVWIRQWSCMENSAYRNFTHCPSRSQLLKAPDYWSFHPARQWEILTNMFCLLARWVAASLSVRHVTVGGYKRSSRRLGRYQPPQKKVRRVSVLLGSFPDNIVPTRRKSDVLRSTASWQYALTAD